MQIIIKNNKRILIKDNNQEVSINDGDIIQYTGIYYKFENDIYNMNKIETTFIGIIQSRKYNHDIGTFGIYVMPLYIWNITNNEWNKIINYTHPNTKYFLYPHLLVLPYIYYHSYPLYFLHTCINKSLDEFTNIIKTFSLDI